MTGILWIGLLVLCVEANILPSSSAEATAPAEAPNKEYRAVQPIGTPEALEFAEQTSSPADSPSMQAPASLSAQWPAATPINRFSNLTEAEIETLKQAFPGGVIPQDDGGVAQQMSTPNYDWKKPAACNNSIGVTADPDDPKCWYWCWSTIFFQPTGRGCRYCCWFDLCWNPPVFLFPLGYCAPCRSPPPPLSPSPPPQPPLPPSPPPSPPAPPTSLTPPLPAQCSINIPVNPQICGVNDRLAIIDNGDGTQRVISSLGYDGACKSNLYPGPCGSYGGSLNLTVANIGAAQYIPPQFAPCLNTLGLGTINYVARLSISVNNGLTLPVPPGTFDFGLSSVQVVDSLYVTEINVQDTFQGARGLESPWASQMQTNFCRVRQGIRIAPIVSIFNVAWSDMTSLAGLRCPGVLYEIVGTLIRSLDGMQNIEAAPDTGPNIFMTQNPLTTGLPLTALSTLALCSNGLSILSTPITITTTDCVNPITTYTQLCRAIGPGFPLCPS